MNKPSRFAEVVAANLRQLRLARELSQAGAAKLAGVSLRTWSVWESPGETAGASVGGNLDAIAKAFGVPLSRLLQMPDGKPFQSALARRPKETKHAAKAVRRFTRKTN